MGAETTARRGSTLPAGIEIRETKNGSSLRITFSWRGQRRRESLNLPATPANIKYAINLQGSVRAAIEKNTFDYAEFFPNSAYAKANEPGLKKRVTVKELVDTYIENARKSKSLSPSTIASYARWSAARICPAWGNRVAEEIQPPELRTWIAELTGEIGQKSIRNCVGLLAAVLARAKSESVIASNPLEPIKLQSILPKKKKTEDEEHVDPFNDDEISAILAHCKTQEERALWQFAFSTGLRTGELIAVKWANIDRINNTVLVEDNIVSAEKGTIEKDTKTGNGRTVPLLPGAIEALAIMEPISKLASPFIFLHPVTRQRWRDDQQMRKGSWTPTLLRAGVLYRIPYQTRHTFASRLLAAGEQELLVAKLLGHATVEMVRRKYGRYINQTKGIQLRGDYSKFGANLGHRGADLGQIQPAYATLNKKPAKARSRA